MAADSLHVLLHVVLQKNYAKNYYEYIQNIRTVLLCCLSWAQSQNALYRKFVKNEFLSASCQAHQTLSGKNSLRQNSHPLPPF